MPLTAIEIARAVAARTARATDIISAALDRIEKIDPSIGAFVCVLRERAMTAADQLDRRSNISSLPLAGVPVVIKDNLADWNQTRQRRCRRGFRHQRLVWAAREWSACDNGP